MLPERNLKVNMNTVSDVLIIQLKTNEGMTDDRSYARNLNKVL